LSGSPKKQPDREIVLYAVGSGGMMDADTANQLRALVEQGKLGAGVFQTEDCRATYEQLSAKGVEFIQPPQEQFYGIEAIFKDDSGNWFSLTQPSRE
jgi:uncharacterized glyoxalase superfamily protein PhnB